MFQDKGI